MTIPSMSLNPSLLKSIREKFGHTHFIETGTYHGGGCLAAVQVGYSEVHSIEMSRPCWLEAVKNVGHMPEVYLYLADSGEFLIWLVRRFLSPLTVFLDGHTVPGLPETAMRSPDYSYPRCPLIEELRALRAQPIRAHVILIDDFDMLDTGVMDHLSKAVVLDELRAINPEYKTETIDGARPGSILYAHLCE